ncbi:hypothetical protein R69746_08220 [Paraburkholderia aspalathi]|uniref:hypothetical protein n=1 Tax=Paraburkholderia aspalathi TaxID=1324617 RepID=UPI00190D8676|nr:hypothetical protein [Paraburkholderia aspalathi]MBK3844138.1 hypothetical protein [Paraburkholderia aspalathi]CAE6867890.1 hypothetical protein R69746_08220 [Paraburkholderia aspalathi]
MFPNNRNDPRLYDPNAYRAWSDASPGGESGTSNWREETRPSSPAAIADSPQYSPQGWHSPAGGPQPRYTEYEDHPATSRTGPSEGNTRPNRGSALSKLGRLFGKISLGQKNREKGASPSHHAGSVEIDDSTDYARYSSHTRSASPARSSLSADLPELGEAPEETSWEPATYVQAPQATAHAAGISEVRIVRSEDRHGCGIACIAMVAGITYAEARQVAMEMGEFNPARGISLDRELVVLRQLGIHSRLKTETPRWNNLPQLAILSLGSNIDFDFRHAVVFSRLGGGQPLIFDANKDRPFHYGHFTQKSVIRACLEINSFSRP